MALRSTQPNLRLLLPVLLVVILGTSNSIVDASDFRKNFAVTWGNGRGKIENNGKLLTLSLDQYSGSGFQSKKTYMFGQIDMEIKLVPGNSAGTVATFFMSSLGDSHDEIDFEFLGNQTGHPYTIHTNVFSQGKGQKEQQFHLWFDPTADFHTYTIIWNPQHIVFAIDGTAIREFKNMESIGVPFPMNKPMRIFASLWNADDWATQGGRIKTDWSLGPFTAAYGRYNIRACKWMGTGSCGTASNAYMTSTISASQREEKIKWVKENHMIYDYCRDHNRFSQGLPAECSMS